MLAASCRMTVCDDRNSAENEFTSELQALVVDAIPFAKSNAGHSGEREP